MPRVNFDPDKDIPFLQDKVIFITGGTAGLGRASVRALAKHDPAHIYFAGRNAQAGQALIDEIKNTSPSVGMTFLKMDMTSLSSVKKACTGFTHDRLDILVCNAGIMDLPPAVSEDGFEIHFAVNHLAHAMIIQQVLPVLQRTTELPDSDVRVVALTSAGWRAHPKNGVDFATIRTKQEDFTMMGFNLRYGANWGELLNRQNKIANVIYAAEIGRRYPKIKAVSIHPGVVTTDLVNNLPPMRKAFVYGTSWLLGNGVVDESKGRLNQLWAAAGAKRDELVSGAYYTPVGVRGKLDEIAKSEELGRELWSWTDEVLAKMV
ncbi:oxidoreductase [Daldinia caldariorum]|uniref:oxidoreductase n=1 Tax=Daldinia caldariorum TaxID=326644 RepID=UPI0020075C4A|nr:oxidoreductase [Daldinia caldariorum]KAI1471273.1 oxidoreductase [Daldinia caldariorum]